METILTNIKERVLQITDYKGIGKEKFFSDLDVSYGNFKGKAKEKALSSDVLANIVTKYSDINPEWLLTGNGEMIKEINNISQEPKLEYKINNKGVPYYDIDFTASFLEVENSQQTQPDSYISHPFFRNCDIVVRASGQSMAKLIKHGDAIGLTRVQNWTEFIPMGEIYAIVTKNNFRMIKIITRGESEGNYTLLSKPTESKKDEFPAQQIKKNQILHIFKVQASATLF
tara:strand:+ start:259 stop:945 length:687 start_codon:yes stop_codon:yes gene_type:complete